MPRARRPWRRLRACGPVQTDGIPKAYARCVVVLAGAARLADTIVAALPCAAEERP